MVINGDSLKELKKFEDNHFDSVVTDPPYGIEFMGSKWDYDVPTVGLWKEVLRVLKPGGMFYCLEFSTPQTNIINKIYNNYKENIIPWIGEKVTKNKEAYKYLEESINLFPNQKELLQNIKKIGYQETNYFNMFNGIVAVHSGFKI